MNIPFTGWTPQVDMFRRHFSAHQKHKKTTQPREGLDGLVGIKVRLNTGYAFNRVDRKAQPTLPH